MWECMAADGISAIQSPLTAASVLSVSAYITVIDRKLFYNFYQNHLQNIPGYICPPLSLCDKDAENPNMN